jgi:hypothetical protein
MGEKKTMRNRRRTYRFSWRNIRKQKLVTCAYCRTKHRPKKEHVCGAAHDNAQENDRSARPQELRAARRPEVSATA